MILLDTCTLLWLAADAQKLSTAARGRMQKQAGELFVSSISAFEIATKCRKGTLELPRSPGQWFEEVLDFHGLIEVTVDGRIAATSAGLPPIHLDPCDRIIVATGQILGLTVLTPDPLIRAYPSLQTDW